MTSPQRGGGVALVGAGPRDAGRGGAGGLLPEAVLVGTLLGDSEGDPGGPRFPE